MMKESLRTIILLLSAVLFMGILSGCRESRPQYVIGVSQCSQDIWRDKLNRELQVGTYFHDGVELRFASADDSDARQIEQIDQFVHDGIDLLIVAPNQVVTVTPAIDRAFDSGIPVIVFDRKTNTEKFTAYIGADNREMGRMMGEYVAAQLQGRGEVLEVMGLKGSSPAIERHEGFVEALSHYPDLHLVASLQGDWTEKSAYEAVSKYDGVLSGIDFVFGQNDRMAMGARRAMLSAAANSSLFTLHSSLPKFCGIDGLPGEGGGIQLVRDSLLSASCIYPTHGDEVLQLALDILEGRPYQREGSLATALVTPDNANVLEMQSAETERQSTYLDQLHLQSDEYLKRLNSQRVITLLACGVIVLLLLVITLFYLFQQGKLTLRRERVVNNLWNLEPEETPTVAQPLVTPPSAPDNPVEETAPSAEPAGTVDGGAGDTSSPTTATDREPSDDDDSSDDSVSASLFIARFKEVVERRLSDSEFSVEDLAIDMHLSRVQLYRKVKNITGSSPVELLRTARLNRGYQLLLTTDKSVSEVAYAVGFTAPSYFAKCFKDEFGQSPSTLANN